MKIKYKQIAKSLTGFSPPVFGFSWNPPETDRAIARKVITFLEDRRALYNPYDMEDSRFVVESLLQVRKELTERLQDTGDESDISRHLRAMRAACRKYLDDTGYRQGRRPLYSGIPMFVALGELRAAFGIQIAQLAVKYGIDVEKDLASILPTEDK